MFFGNRKSLVISHSQLLSIIYGNEFALSEEEYHKGVGGQFSLADSITFGLIIGVFVGSAAGYLGSIMVSKHVTLVEDILSHVALPGQIPIEEHSAFCKNKPGSVVASNIQSIVIFQIF